MQIIKTKGNLRLYAGADCATGLFIAENIKTGKMSLWSSDKNIKLSECKY